MGFTVIVEVSYGDGFVASRLPTKQGGKAVFAFLMGLQGYCILREEMQPREWYEWFQNFQISIAQPLCTFFKPIMDCIWGDGGGIGGEFFEDEYEWYRKRNPNPFSPMTEDEFREFVRGSLTRWSPIELVIANVKILNNVFKTADLTDVDALYIAKDMIPDFEALYDTLIILENYGYETVRLNFF